MRLSLLLACLIALVGCGGPENIGRVSGVVTLDGQPLADATIVFSPKKGGSPSAGRTNASGEYELQYTNDIVGAELGEHTVTISSFRAAVKDAEPPIERSPERVPEKYNINTTLVGQVESGSNTINFDLKADGPIIQPDSKARSREDE